MGSEQDTTRKQTRKEGENIVLRVKRGECLSAGMNPLRIHKGHMRTNTSKCSHSRTIWETPPPKSNLASAVPKRGRSKRGRMQKDTNERKRAQTQERKRRGDSRKLRDILGSPGTFQKLKGARLPSSERLAKIGSISELRICTALFG